MFCDGKGVRWLSIGVFRAGPGIPRPSSTLEPGGLCSGQDEAFQALFHPFSQLGCIELFYCFFIFLIFFGGKSTHNYIFRLFGVCIFLQLFVNQCPSRKWPNNFFLFFVFGFSKCLYGMLFVFGFSKCLFGMCIFIQYKVCVIFLLERNFPTIHTKNWGHLFLKCLSFHAHKPQHRILANLFLLQAKEGQTLRLLGYKLKAGVTNGSCQVIMGLANFYPKKQNKATILWNEFKIFAFFPSEMNQNSWKFFSLTLFPTSSPLRTGVCF